MYSRLLTQPDGSFFLFGPRGTGKSTWIKERVTAATFYDLLNTAEVLRLSRAPESLFSEVATQPRGSWVVIDEVQKVPALLDEVHRLIEARGHRFVLSGSSARKLRRGGANLLAGRAIIRHLFPLVSSELGFAHALESMLVHGTLPMAVTGSDPVGYLSAYAQTYLQEEIRAEALTRNIGHFSRFLEVAARQNGLITNVSAIARDAAVSRQTVQNYFDILVDTLLGNWLPAWKLKRATKQVAHPKFYLFDCGVARALSGRLPYPPTSEELGVLLETLVVNEIRAHLHYAGLDYPLHFWRTPDGVEVDLLCETRKGYVAVEVKAATRWERRDGRGLTRLAQELGESRLTSFGVFRGERAAQWNGLDVLPALDFLRRLWNGEVFPS